MSKIIYVPKWLKRHLDTQDERLDILDTDDIRSVIICDADVFNYVFDQALFAKLLVDKVIKETLPANITNTYEKAYSLMRHNDTPYCMDGVLAISNELKVPGVKDFFDPTDTKLTYHPSEDGRVVYVVAEPGSHTIPEGKTISDDIICSVLGIAHNRLRTYDGTVDKSSVLRENPTLADFYVSTLLVR